MEFEEIAKKLNELIYKKDRRIAQSDTEISALKKELGKEKAQNMALTTEISEIKKKISTIESLWNKSQ